MEAWLGEIAKYVELAIEAMAVLLVGFASAEAFIRIARLAFRTATEEDKRAIYMRYLRWLVAALTFQLAADIVHTTIAPTWEELGLVAGIAVIRTFLGFFLERDVRQAEAES